MSLRSLAFCKVWFTPVQVFHTIAHRLCLHTFYFLINLGFIGKKEFSTPSPWPLIDTGWSCYGKPTENSDNCEVHRKQWRNSDNRLSNSGNPAWDGLYLHLTISGWMISLHIDDLVACWWNIPLFTKENLFPEHPPLDWVNPRTAFAWTKSNGIVTPTQTLPKSLWSVETCAWDGT